MNKKQIDSTILKQHLLTKKERMQKNNYSNFRRYWIIDKESFINYQ